MRKIFIIIACFLVFPYCSKDSGKHCWGAVDSGGNDVPFSPNPCGITKKEMQDRFPNWWIYNADAPKYCWREQYPSGTGYTPNLAEAVIERRSQIIPGYTASKVDCSNFCNLEWREYHKSKITGSFGPTYAFRETLVNSDTCAKLFTGRVITIRETTDSLITRELIGRKP